MEMLTMNSTLAPATVIRVSRGTFDPARFAEVDRMTRETGKYLIPAIKELPGLLNYFCCGVAYWVDCSREYLG